MSLVSPRSALRRRAWAVAGVSTAVAVAAAVPLASPVAAAPAAPAVSAAPAAYDGLPRTYAAGWLLDQMSDGIMTNGYVSGGQEFYFEDYGMTADVGRVLVESGFGNETIAEILDALAPNTAESTAPGGYVSAGSTAKLAAFVDLAGQDARAFGGTDLVAQLEGRVSTTAPTAGRVSDDFDPSDEFGADYANVFGQSYAVEALRSTESDLTDSAAGFLAQQQCADGSFRLYFSPADAPDQSCDGAGDTGSVDATARAVLALLPDASGDAELRTVVADAVSWLVRVQKASGAFDDGDQLGPNANSTGLAGEALGKARALEGNPFRIGGQAERAAVWLRLHQVAEAPGCITALANNRGAVAYDDAALVRGQARDIDGLDANYQWKLATVQSAGALAFAPAASGPLGFRSPTGRVRAGTAIPLVVAGLAPGQRGCFTGSGIPQASTTGTSARVVMPRGNGLRNLYLSTGDYRQPALRIQVWALDAARFQISTTRQVRVGAEVQLTLAGLAPGERFTVSYRGQARRAGVADGSGRAQLRFVGALNPGTFGLSVVGEYVDRTASSSFVVTR